MTKEYASKFWMTIFRALSEDPEERILTNPAVDFTEKVKSGAFDHLSDEAYNAMLSDVEEQNALFLRQRCATSYAVLLRAISRLQLTDTERHTILRVLVNASTRTDFRKETVR